VNPVARARNHEYQLPRALREEALRELLTGFRLQRQDPVRSTLWLLDTFDWRLFRTGLRAILDDEQLRFQYLADGRPAGDSAAVAPPVFAAAVEPGVCEGRLARILSVRALLPVAGVRLASTTYEVLDDDGKTVARLHLEHRRYLAPDGGETTPRKRLLVLEPIHGHGASRKALAKVLGHHFPDHGPAGDICARALEACPRRPGEMAGRLDMVLDPAARADESMKVILGRLHAAMADNLPGMLAGVDPEFLHDYRVAVRRTRSVLTQVRGVFTDAITRRYREHFSHLGALTGPARDADVYLLALVDYRALLEPALGPALDAFADFLRERRAREYGRLREELSRPRQRRMMAAWGDFLARPVPRRPAAVNAVRPVKGLADERIWKMFRRVMKEGRAITAAAPPEALHELRKSCKKLRYLMEFFASLYPAADTSPLIKALKRFQDNLGEYQDLSVQMTQLAGFEAEMARDGCLTPATRQAMEALVVRLEARRGEVRDAFDERFAAFSEPTVLAAFGTLYHAGRG